MKRFNKVMTALLVVVMVFSLSACGSSANGARSADAVPEAAYMPDTALVSNNGFSYAEEESYDFEMPAEAPSAAAPAAEQSAPEGPGIAEDKSIDRQKIIYSADVTVESTEFDTAVEKLEALVDHYKGFIESSRFNGNRYYYSSYGSQSSKSAEYRIRIPSDAFNDVLTGMNDIGNVPYTNTYSENITAQYYDTEARMNAYKAQEARLLEMVEAAETVEDLITIEDRLTWIRYEIESLQSTMKNWDRQVNYSTINVSIVEVKEYTPEAEISFGEEFKMAVKSGLSNAGDFVKRTLIVAAESLPTLLIITPFVVLAIVIVVRTRRKRKGERKLSEKKNRVAVRMPATSASEAAAESEGSK